MIRINVQKKQGAFELNVAGESDAGILGLFGPSGCGKSTLMDILAGFRKPDAGEAHIQDQVLFTAESIIQSIRNRRIGYAAQEPCLFPHLSVRRNLGFGRHSPNGKLDADSVVRSLGLDDLLDRSPASLSGGEARRVSIGRALLSPPSILLLDEPTAGLDRALAARVLTFLRTHIAQSDIPTIFASHSISEHLFFCDETWRMSAGKLCESGTPNRLLLQIQVQDADFHELDNIVEAVVVPGRTETITTVQIHDRLVEIDGPAWPLKAKVVLRLRASDIMVTTRMPEAISARNILPGIVLRMDRTERVVWVHVRAGVDWIAAITPQSALELELKPGSAIFLLFKATSAVIS